MTAKKGATSAKHKTKTKKHAAAKKHTETKAQAAHLHTLHVEHEAHLAHLKKIGVKAKPAAHAKAAKAKAFAVGDWLPVCSFEALAMSLRLAGQPVHGDEVAELWELAGAAEATSVEDALAAAARFGLAGYHAKAVQVGLRALQEDMGGFGVLRGHHPLVGLRELAEQAEAEDLAHAGVVVEEPFKLFGRLGPVDGCWSGISLAAAPDGAQDRYVPAHGLILGVDRPGPHAVLATADGWWSWGEPYDPWACRIDSVTAVSWS